MSDSIARKFFHVCAGATLIFVESQQRSAILDGEPEAAGAGEESEVVPVPCSEFTIAVGGSTWFYQADIFVIPDGLRRKAALGRHIADVHKADSSFDASNSTPSSNWKERRRFQDLIILS